MKALQSPNTVKGITYWQLIMEPYCQEYYLLTAYNGIPPPETSLSWRSCLIQIYEPPQGQSTSRDPWTRTYKTLAPLPQVRAMLMGQPTSRTPIGIAESLCCNCITVLLLSLPSCFLHSQVLPTALSNKLPAVQSLPQNLFPGNPT